MKKFVVILSTFLLMFSCSETSEVNLSEVKTPAMENEAKQTKVEKLPVDENAEVQLDITGMSCHINCVVKVKHELKQMAGVGSIEVDFDKDRPTDVATIKYDSKITSPEKMIELIQSVNDGAYQAKKSEVKEDVKDEEANLNNSWLNSLERKLSANSIEIPSIIRLVTILWN